MKKEKIEFTILRYLGRPPSLFDDQAIAAVAEILEGNSKFDWDKFTEYATFHKLSQTLYPNLKKFENANQPSQQADYGSTRVRECASSEEEEDSSAGVDSSAEVRKCESSRVENAGNAEHMQEKLGKEKENRQSNVECRDSEEEKLPLAPPRLAPLVPPSGRRCQTSSDGGVVSNERTTKNEQRITKKIPEFVINKFRGIFLANAARNEFLAQELVKINKLMADNGIEMLNWKGPTLAIQAYGDLSLRQFKDLDTLVKYEDLEKAKAILIENGFDDITPSHTTRNPTRNCYELIHSEKKYTLEVETELMFDNTPITLPYSDIFINSDSLTFSSESEIHILSIIDNLFFLSFHGTKHLWHRLRWLVDIIALYEKEKDEINKGLESYEEKDICIFSIYAAYKTFNIDCPNELSDFAEQYSPDIYDAIDTKIQVSKMGGDKMIGYNKGNIVYQLLNSKANKKRFWKSSIRPTKFNRYFLKLIPDYSDYCVIKLPQLLYPLYFFIRPIRIFKKKLSKVELNSYK